MLHTLVGTCTSFITINHIMNRIHKSSISRKIGDFIDIVFTINVIKEMHHNLISCKQNIKINVQSTLIFKKFTKNIFHK